MEEPRYPVSDIDYPGTFQDFDKWFSSENACLEYIAKIRWSKGFICPGCGENAAKPSLMGRGLSFAENVNGRRPSLRELCFMGVTNNFGRGFSLFGS